MSKSLPMTDSHLKEVYVFSKTRVEKIRKTERERATDLAIEQFYPEPINTRLHIEPLENRIGPRL